MIVVMESGAPAAALERVMSHLVAAGCDVHQSSGSGRLVLGVVGPTEGVDAELLEELDGVAQVVRVSAPARRVSRDFRAAPSVVEGPWGAIGAPSPWIAIEPVGLPEVDVGRAAPEPLHGSPESVPPPSQPLRYEVAAGRPFNAAVVRRALAPEGVGALSCLSIHERPIEPRWPVLFVPRRECGGAQAWLSEAERELERGGAHLVLLETGSLAAEGGRGLDVMSLVRIKRMTHLPVVVDVPLVARHRQACAAVALAAIAAGADGVVLRVWVGPQAAAPRTAATLDWEGAMGLAESLRAMSQVLR